MGQIILHTANGSHRIYEERSFPIVIEYAYNTEGGSINKRYELQLSKNGLCLLMQKKEYTPEGEESEK